MRETLRDIYDTLGRQIENIALERIVSSPGLTGVKLSNGTGGLCSTHRESCEEADPPAKDVRLPAPTGKSREKKIIDCINDAFGSIPSRKAVGMAIVNALSATCSRLVAPVGYEVRREIGFLSRAVLHDAAYTVVSGVLEPVVSSLRKAGTSFGVLGAGRASRKEDLAEWYIPPAMVSKRVGQADLLILAGTTLMDDGLEYLLSLRKREARVYVSGPAATMLPGAFFRRGVSALHGLVVTDPDTALDAIAGSAWDYILFGKGTEKVVMQPVPGKQERAAEKRQETVTTGRRPFHVSPERRRPGAETDASHRADGRYGYGVTRADGCKP